MRLIAIMCVLFVSIGIAAVAWGQQASSDTQALQRQMLGNPEIMALIMSLQNDPDVQQVLSDPEIMKAINAGDLSTLMASPGFMRILDKQAVRDIGTKLQK